MRSDLWGKYETLSGCFQHRAKKKEAAAASAGLKADTEKKVSKEQMRYRHIPKWCSNDNIQVDTIKAKIVAVLV